MVPAKRAWDVVLKLDWTIGRRTKNLRWYAQFRGYSTCSKIEIYKQVLYPLNWAYHGRFKTLLNTFVSSTLLSS